METGPWPHLDRRQERGVVWGGRHRFLLEVPANFVERRYGEVRRISIPRTSVNKGRTFIYSGLCNDIDPYAHHRHALLAVAML